MSASSERLHGAGLRRLAATVVLTALAVLGCRREAAPGPESAGAAPAATVPQTELEYGLVKTYESGMTELRGIAIDEQGGVYLAGAQGVRTLGADGTVTGGWRTSGPAHCVAVASDGKVWAGLTTSVEVYDPSGSLVDSWGTEGSGPGELKWVTSIVVQGTNVFVADAGNRCIHRYDVTGDFIDDIGKRDRDAGFVGILCPSPYLDVAADSEGVLYVTNPGQLRVERYGTDGRLLGHWGKPGMQPGRFCGCCNPTNVALLDGGRVVTAEKGMPRVTVYDASGRMLAYLGPEHFTAGAAGLDLAVGPGGRIHVTDPGDGNVRVFELRE